MLVLLLLLLLLLLILGWLALTRWLLLLLSWRTLHVLHSHEVLWCLELRWGHELVVGLEVGNLLILLLLMLLLCANVLVHAGVLGCSDDITILIESLNL